MEPRFRAVERDQSFLMPPDVREWLPVGHPALFVVELVGSLDLSGFVAGYRSTRDRGRPAYHPVVMVGIVLYASMSSVVSSRRIERLLATDVGFRVVAANQRPDHGTICRFIARHRDALEGLFAQVVGLAAEAGLVDPTLVALDGTTMASNASKSQNRKLGDLRAWFGDWADTVEANDAAEEHAHAEAQERGEGPIPEMSDHDAMRTWIRQRLADRASDPDGQRMNVTDPDSALMPRKGGGWLQGYNAQAAAVQGGIVVCADVSANPADGVMLEPMVSRISSAITAACGQGAGVVVADAGYWDTETIEEIDNDSDQPDVLVATGRHLPRTAPDPLPEPDLAAHRSALADHQAALDTEHARRIPVIARVIDGELLLREAADLLAMSIPRVSELKRAWHKGPGPDAIRPQRLPRQPRPRPPTNPTRPARARHAMDTRLASPAGRSLYRQRQATIEPVFGDIKTNRRITRFSRRGIHNIRAEWHWILTGHNLTILHKHTP
jgi:transposase